ncbi:MAG: hypothetical protein ACPLRU_03810 [Desulfofundulus sp.]
MKRGVLVVVALLALASVMAAMAYTSATVTHPASMSIVNSAKAYLRVYPSFHQNSPEVGYKDVNVFVDEDGRFKFDFTKGAHGVGATGFQPGSRYEFNDLFCIYNESKDTVEYWLENVGMKYITIKAGNTILINNGEATGNKVAIGSSAGTWYLDVIFDIPENANLEDLSGTIIVHAQPR